LITDDWSLKASDKKHNHEMSDELKGYKTVGRLNPNENRYLHELANSKVPPRHILTNLRNMNNRTSNTRQSTRGLRTEMKHIMKPLVENKYIYHEIFS